MSRSQQLVAAAIGVIAACSAVGVAAAAPNTVASRSVPTIGVAHGHLTLGGAPYRFVGLNAYELATYWGRNAGCGAMVRDAQLDHFFAAQPAHSFVRIWAWQGSMAINYRTKQLDWGPLDRVFDAAAKHGDFLLVSLTGQDGTCDDGHWKSAGWYRSGYRRAHDDDGRGLAPMPYRDYVREIVQRYRTSPALGMWEPVNEPETSLCGAHLRGSQCYAHLTCPSERRGAMALRQFFDAVGGEIHRLDPRHLVESGLIGGGQCGTAGDDYRFVNASPGIDVLSYHDYYGAGARIGGDQWNGIGLRLRQAAALGKPIIGGEVGVAAGRAGACTSRPQRRSHLRAKANRQMAAGSDGVLIWDWEPKPTARCDYSTYPGDPSLALVGPRR